MGFALMLEGGQAVIKTGFRDFPTHEVNQIVQIGRHACEVHVVAIGSSLISKSVLWMIYSNSMALFMAIIYALCIHCVKNPWHFPMWRGHSAAVDIGDVDTHHQRVWRSKYCHVSLWTKRRRRVHRLEVRKYVSVIASTFEVGVEVGDVEVTLCFWQTIIFSRRVATCHHTIGFEQKFGSILGYWDNYVKIRMNSRRFPHFDVLIQFLIWFISGGQRRR